MKPGLLKNHLQQIPQQTFNENPSQTNNLSLPSTWDWRSKGVVGPVENEGSCGSCWAFVIKETMESVCALAGYPLYDLSAQQLLDCDNSEEGCDGGELTTAANYIMKYGLETNASYPYVAEQGNCSYNHNEVVDCKIESWKYVGANQSETIMQKFVYENSPIAACLDADTWSTYKGGVITTKSKCGNFIDHCVQVVGWTVMSGVNAWILRNQWGTDFGVEGYVFVEMGANVCGITAIPFTVCVKGKDGKTVC